VTPRHWWGVLVAQELDDTTAAEIGHALLRWVIDDDPGEVGRFVRDLDASTVDDARAARIGHALVDVLQSVNVV
jgi:hypothetical protein